MGRRGRVSESLPVCLRRESGFRAAAPASASQRNSGVRQNRHMKETSIARSRFPVRRRHHWHLDFARALNQVHAPHVKSQPHHHCGTLFSLLSFLNVRPHAPDILIARLPGRTLLRSRNTRPPEFKAQQHGEVWSISRQRQWHSTILSGCTSFQQPADCAVSCGLSAPTVLLRERENTKFLHSSFCSS